MDRSRRVVLKGAGAGGALAAALATGLLKPGSAAAAWNKGAFDAKTTADAMKALGMANASESKDIQIRAPEIAANGAVVPLDITSNIPGTTSISPSSRYAVLDDIETLPEEMPRIYRAVTR